jgi:hypothetical protein
VSFAAANAGVAAAQSTAPWWDNFPRIVNFPNQTCGTQAADKAVTLNADVAFCSSAHDPSFGIWSQRTTILQEDEPQAFLKMHSAGLKTQSYFETFGCSTNFVVQVKKNSDGTFVKATNDPQLTRSFANWWAWDQFDGTGEIHWAGAHGYFGDEDFSRPYTLTHARYGSPPAKYPNGTIATGYNGANTDPRNSRVYDACAAKDVTGGLAYDWAPSTSHQQAGFVQVGAQSAGLLYINKDSSCPSWIDYARASALQAIDYGLDSMWSDNFSPWNSFGYSPVRMAFGEWSVATFRNYLTTNFSPGDLAAMGVQDVTTYDVRIYLRAKASSWSGSPISTGGGASNGSVDPIWSDVRWLDDPVWRAYKIHRRQAGTQALSNYYHAVKAVAAAAGQPDFLVTGNDFDGVNMGWARGDLDMVDSELTYTPSSALGNGQYGYRLPPLGSYVPVYKKAHEQARSRFSIFWLYVGPELVGRPGIADVLQYQGLANHSLPEPWSGVSQPQTAGNDATTAAFHEFVGSARSTFGQRTPIEEIGLYYSSSSELAHLTLNGWPDNDGAAPHSLSFLGWGTALTWLHDQWKAVPEWKLTTPNLSRIKLLIIPSSEVFDLADVQVLQDWITQGGRLIVTGNSGARAGEPGNFQSLSALSFAKITGVSTPNDPRQQVLAKLGSGLVLYLRDDIGIPFTNSTTTRPDQLLSFSAALSAVGFSGSVAAPSAPYTVGVTLYDDASSLRRFVDVNNTDIDVSSDTIHPTPLIHMEVALPPWLASRSVTSEVLTPDIGVEAAIQQTNDGTVKIDVTGTLRYASIVLQPSASAPQSPTLGIQMTHTGNFTQAQQGATYNLLVSNNAFAPTTVGTVTVPDTFTPGLTLVAMVGTGWNCTANTCTREDGLAGGASYPPIIATVNVSGSAISPQVNQASVSGGGSATSNASDSTIVGVVQPTLSINRRVLNFGVSGPLITSPQTVLVTMTGGAGMAWTATSDRSNIMVSPTAGVGTGMFQISASSGPNGIVTVIAAGATNSPQTIQVNVIGVTPTLPFGSFDTPATNTTGVVGAIPVTGWALDNIEVTHVDIFREPVAGEPSGNLVFVGTTVLVADARPDVATQFPTFPYQHRAGWGYQMLTGSLPNAGGYGAPGNGTYKLHAIAFNKANRQLDLGTRTITVDNAHSAKPFGTIDTPEQGGTIFGTDSVNFGWALTPKPGMIPTDGSTIMVVIDGVVVGHPTYGQLRPDIANLFPSFANSMGAVGFFHINTTILANGVHTISWNVFDNLGRGDGLGSRYFNVLNAGGAGAGVPQEVIGESVASQGVRVRHGLHLNRPPDPVAQDSDGLYSVTMEEVGHIELHLGATSGNLLVAGDAHGLPIGSTLKGGVFSWQPGPGFLGEYTLQFARPDGTRIPVRVNIVPKRYSIEQ